MSLRRDRAGRLAKEAATNSHDRGGPLANRQLAGIEAATIGDILQREADRPLRGGGAELGHESLFGDSHKQRSLF